MEGINGINGINGMDSICKTEFIINALKDGWSVRMNNDSELVFTKDKDSISPDMEKNTYSKKFLDKYGKF